MGNRYVTPCIVVYTETVGRVETIMVFWLNGWSTELGVGVSNHDMRNIIVGVGGTQFENTFLAKGNVWSFSDGSPTIS